MAAQLIVRTLAAIAICAVASEVAWARDCRIADAPPGVRVPDRPGCRSSAGVAGARAPRREGRDTGFIDLGNGTEVRVSGRVRMETRGGR